MIGAVDCANHRAQSGESGQLARKSRTTTLYDALGRVTATINPVGARTSFAYDSRNNRVRVTNPLGAHTTTVYDAVNQPIASIDPLHRRTTSVYDLANNQTLRIDARGNRTTYVYNVARELTQRRYPDGSRTTFAYDANGNRNLSENAAIRTTTVYNALNLPSSVTTEGNGVSKHLSYHYDAISQRTGLTDPDGGRFTYSYDANGQLIQLVNPQGDVTTSSYDANERRTLRRLANGTRASFTYDVANNLTRLVNLTSTSVTISSYDYQYDAVGHRTRIVENNGDVTTYSYDAIYQLTEEHRQSPADNWTNFSADDWDAFTADAWDTFSTGSVNYRNTFTYDANRNRTVKVINGERTTVLYDAADQIRYAQAAVGRTTYTFDANGNETLVLEPDGARTTTSWSYENDALVIATPENGAQTSTYSPDSLRVKKQDDEGTTHFIYDGQAYLLETNHSNATVAVYTNEPTTYGYLASQYRFDPISSLWLPSYYHQDALGSTMQLTDDSEAVTDTYQYDAWGEILTRTGDTENPFLWIGAWGYYKDRATGLYYVRRRDYRASTGRWTKPDPLLFVDGPNLYVAYFVPDSIDPSGMEGFWRGYWHYLWNPSQMDSDLQCCQKVALTTAAVSLGAAGGLSIAGYAGVSQIGTVGLSALPTQAALELHLASGGVVVLTETCRRHLDRPYQYSNAIVNAIVRGTPGRLDPGGLQGALRYYAPGTFNGSRGTYELVIDSSGRIVHFLFRGGK